VAIIMRKISLKPSKYSTIRGSTKNFPLNTLRRLWRPPAISQVEDHYLAYCSDYHW
jgi:hypothetical protein